MYVFVCMLSCECVLCVVLYVWGEWTVENVSRFKMRRTWQIKSDTTLKNITGNMTCVAFCQLESLFWFVWTFCYCFNFIINIIVYVWQWASCQPQCPPSQFHCPLCNHMGALQHFSTLFESTQPGMHCEEQHKVEATLPESPLDVCLWWIFISAFYSGPCDRRINVVLVCLRSIFTSSTTFWLMEAGKNGSFSWVLAVL